MLITVNGETRKVEAGSTGADLLGELNIAAATVVAEYNGTILAQGDFLGQMLTEGDVLELVTLVGGG